MNEYDRMATKRANTPTSLSPPTRRIRESEDFHGEFVSALGCHQSKIRGKLGFQLSTADSQAADV